MVKLGCGENAGRGCCDPEKVECDGGDPFTLEDRSLRRATKAGSSSSAVLLQETGEGRVGAFTWAQFSNLKFSYQLARSPKTAKAGFSWI